MEPPRSSPSPEIAANQLNRTAKGVHAGTAYVSGMDESPLNELNRSVQTISKTILQEPGTFSAASCDEILRNCQVVKADLENKLSSGEIDQREASSLLNGLSACLKLLEKENIPEEIRKHPAFQGNAIKMGIEHLKGQMDRERIEPPRIQHFVRSYCQSLLGDAKTDAKYRDKICYLLRKCSSIPDGTFEGKELSLFVVEFSNNRRLLIGFELSTGKWHQMKEREDGSFRLNEEFDSLKELLGDDAIKQTVPLEPYNPEKIRNYAVEYSQFIND